MRTAVYSILAILMTYCQSILAAVGESPEYAPPPLVSIVWVWVFVAVFVGICMWFGIALWRAEKKDRAQTSAAATAQHLTQDPQQDAS
jgi:heme/copper-type cytochrome/quinol oxidase subunit 2